LVLSYRRHFVALLVVAVALILLFDATAAAAPIARFDLYFACVGLLHALAVILALTGDTYWVRRVVFLAIAMILSVGAPYAGLLASGVLPLANDTVKFFAIYALASASGALAYWVVIRTLWLPHLTLSSVALTISWCVAATMLSLVVGVLGSGFGSRPDAVPRDLPTLAWWIAFSLSLGETERRLANKRLQPAAGAIMSRRG
jgi:hypothetical protein